MKSDWSIARCGVRLERVGAQLRNRRLMESFWMIILDERNGVG